MRFGLGRFVTLLAVIGAFTGCGWDRSLAPDKDLALARSSSSGGASFALSATAPAHNEIVLTWQDNVPNEFGFEIHRSTNGASGTFTSYATVAANITAMIDARVSDATEYCYMIRSVFVRGRKTTYSSFSNVSCVTTPSMPLPDAPSNITAKPQGSNSASVAWTAVDNGLDGFRVERSGTSDGPWATAATTTAGTRMHTDGSLVSEMAICYRVIAFNKTGASAPSSVDCTHPPAAPTNLLARPHDASSIDLRWTDNSSVEDGYEVRRAAPNGGWTVVATLPANAAGYRDTGLSSDTQYSYYVLASKDGGYSYSIFGTATIFSAAPAAPSSIDVRPNSSSSVGVSWSGQQNAAGYRIERSTDGGSSWVTAYTYSWAAWRFDDEERTPEERVWYRVFAFNNNGESPPSPIGSTTPPAYPTNVVTVPIDEQTVEVRWTDNSSVEDGYEVVTYWYECYDWGCYYDPNYVSYTLPPNTTSHRFPKSEELLGVIAQKDGGYSSWGWPGLSESSSLSPSLNRARSSPPPRTQLRPLRKSPNRVGKE